MSPAQILLVQQSFASIAPASDRVAALLYERLFTLDPTLRALFRDDMKGQGEKLMATLAFFIYNLRAPDLLNPHLVHLGRRHVAYGVQPEDYDLMGQALLWAVAQTLGAAFTPELAAAWRACFRLLVEKMKAGAAPEEHNHGL